MPQAKVLKCLNAYHAFSWFYEQVRRNGWNSGRFYYYNEGRRVNSEFLSHFKGDVMVISWKIWWKRSGCQQLGLRMRIEPPQRLLKLPLPLLSKLRQRDSQTHYFSHFFLSRVVGNCSFNLSFRISFPCGNSLPRPDSSPYSIPLPISILVALPGGGVLSFLFESIYSIPLSERDRVLRS